MSIVPTMRHSRNISFRESSYMGPRRKRRPVLDVEEDDLNGPEHEGMQPGPNGDQNSLAGQQEQDPSKPYFDRTGALITPTEDGGVEIDFSPPREGQPDEDDFNANLAEFLEPSVLRTIASDLLEGIEADLNSRAEWESMRSKAIELLGTKLMETGSSTSTGNVSKVYNTVLMEACVRYQANAGAELMPASGPVKVDDESVKISAVKADTAVQAPPALPPGPVGGPGPAVPPGVIPGMAASASTPPPLPAAATAIGGLMPQGPPLPAMMGHNGGPPMIDREQLANNFETDFNHYLTVVADEWETDTDRMLFRQGLDGIAFKKVFHCPLRRRPCSDFVAADDLIVSNDATTLKTAGRLTHRQKIRQSVMKRMQYLGVYRDIPLVQPTEEPTEIDSKIKSQDGIDPTPASNLPDDQQHEVYECYVDYDIPGFEDLDENGEPTGLPLSYRVTIDKDSEQILAIYRNWDEHDENKEADETFVAYPLVPGLGFYAYGFSHLVGNQARAMTAITRLLIDAGMFANFPGFLRADMGSKQQSNQIRIMPGGSQPIHTGGLPIDEVVMQLPYKDPSTVLLEFLQYLAGESRALCGMVELPVGEGKADIPVGTMIMLIEQSTKIMGAIHKRNHRAQKREFLLLKKRFAEDPKALWVFAKNPTRKWEAAEEFKDIDLVPASDPNVPSHLHRIMQGLVIANRADAHPERYKSDAVEKRIMKTMGIDDTEELLAPPPDPNAPTQKLPQEWEQENIKLQAQAREAEQNRELTQEMTRFNNNKVLKQMDLDGKATDHESRLTVANIDFAREKLAADASAHGSALKTAGTVVAAHTDMHTSDRELAGKLVDAHADMHRVGHETKQAQHHEKAEGHKAKGTIASASAAKVTAKEGRKATQHQAEADKAGASAETATAHSNATVARHNRKAQQESHKAEREKRKHEAKMAKEQVKKPGNGDKSE